MSLKFWIKINDLIPKTISLKFQKKIGFSSGKFSNKEKVGFIFAFPFFSALAVILILNIFFNIINYFELATYFIIITVSVFILLFLIIDSNATKKAKNIEENLPDALELIAINIKSGLTIENALIESARPEFLELSSLFKRAAKEMFSGSSFENSFKKISEKIESNIFEKTISLIVEGVQKGGELGDLLLKIADDLRDEQSMRKEINANISIYITLIIISAGFAAPILFGASTVVADTLDTQTSFRGGESNISRSGIISDFFGIDVGINEINKEAVQFFSIISMLITSFFASILIGIIKFNKETLGLKYFPVLATISIVIYFIVISLLGNLM